VDDNINLCKTMSFVLKRKGYEVSIAENGQQAIESVRERPFDLIFLDIKMSIMNGVETYKEIRKIRPEVLVMMMTAYRQEMNQLVSESINNNAYTCIYKPFDMVEILEMVEGIVNRKGGRKR